LLSTSGQIYGVSASGGENSNGGTIFKLNLDGSQLSEVHNFTVEEGYRPQAGLLDGKDGYFYGTTTSGVIGTGGSIYKISSDGNFFLKLFEFVPETGTYPTADLLLVNQSLYGTTRFGGLNGLGTIYKINPDGSGFLKLFDFDGENGALPISGLTFYDGKLYGTTYKGGDYDMGIIFRIDFDGVNFTKLADFSHKSGGNPLGALILEKTAQTITFESIPAKVFGDPDFNLSATASSGLPITYLSSDTNIATITNNTVTILHSGTVTITAIQEGTADFATSSSQQILSINKAGQVIAFDKLENKIFGGFDFSLIATTSSGRAVAYTSSNPLVATVDGNVVTLVGAGITTIIAYQEGDADYASASSEQTLMVTKASQTIAFDTIPDKTFGDAKFALFSTASSGLYVQFTSASDKITINGSEVTLVSAGRAAIEANQSGNSNYNAAPEVEQRFCINPAKPTITSSDPNTEVILTSNASSGNQWYLNDEVLPNATSITLAVTKSGSYTVNSTIDDCSSEISDAISLIITGLEDASSQVRIYPNPVNGSLYVNLGGLSGNVSITIYDLLGRRKDSSTARGKDILTIDTSSYSSGSYILVVSHSTGTIHKKFIKN